MSSLDQTPMNLVADSLERSTIRNWSRGRTVGALSQEEALEIVVEVFAQQALETPVKGATGVQMFEAILKIGEYFKDTTPTDEKVDAVAVRAETDYYAFLVLDFLWQLSKSRPTRALKDWDHKRYLGVVRQPPVPPGTSPTKNVHRDKLIVSQIRELEAVGFVPTRNTASEHSGSGCDIVMAAIQRMGTHMSYAAVEAIWRNRDRIPAVGPIADLLKESLMSVTPNSA